MTLYIFSLSFFILIFTFYIYPNEAIAPNNPSYLELQIPNKSSLTTLLAVGDVMLSRNIGTAIDKTNNPNLPFEKVRDLLNGADITFGNLECPLSDSDIPIREGLVFRCLTKYVPGLRFAGFDVMSTANNHSFDQGEKQIGFTVDYLKSQNILPVGTGKDFKEAHAGTVVSPPREGEMQEGVMVRFGFLAYSYSARNDGKKTIDPQIATVDSDQVAKDIQSIKNRGADIVIISMHAGIEYTRRPNPEQIDFAHAAIDAGADVVIGHHPHWIQDIEIYPPFSPPASSESDGIGGDPPASSREASRAGEEGVHRGLILYSLGNFVFDQAWSADTTEGLAVELTFANDKLESAKLIPIVIENNCCPRIATEEEKQKILKKNNQESDIIQF